MSTGFDVAIVGGGSAGVAAAVASASYGAHTLLLERRPELGGNISQAFVHTICGLYFSADAGPPEYANPGLPQRFATSLIARGAARDPVRAGRVWVLPTDPFGVAAVASDWCAATAGLECLRATELTGIELSTHAPGEQLLRVRDASGATLELRARCVVDATGEANVAVLGGAAVREPDPEQVQLPSYIFRLANVATEALDELAGFGRLRVTNAIAGAARDGVLPPGCESVLVRPGFEPGSVFVTLNLPRSEAPGWDPRSEVSIAAAQAQAQDSARKLVDYLRQHREAFAACRVDRWPARIGVREGRRLEARRELSAADVVTGRRSADEVAVSTWPIELWRDHRRAHFEYPSGPSSIPLAALASRSHAGLAAAGRCLGADADALGALRVIGTALATGEAAGVAAAMAADSALAVSAVAAADVRAQIEAGRAIAEGGSDVTSGPARGRS